MAHFVLRRLLVAIPVLIGVSILIFILVRLAPGDPILAIFGLNPRTPEAVARVRAELGLDDPLVVQYFSWVGRALRGDFGNSLYANQPVSTVILDRLPITATLATTSLVMAVSLGIPLGVWSATKRDRLFDNVGRFLAILAVSMPVFWFGLLLLLLFAVQWPLFPAGGSFAEFGVRALVLPTITLGLAFTGIVMRLTRSSVLEVLQEDYIRTARSKGLGSGRINFNHALGNSLIPVLTVVGIQTGVLLSGAVLTETVFAIPGLGRLMLDGVAARDYPLVMGTVLVVAVIYLVINLIVDILYAVLDPRIRYA